MRRLQWRICLSLALGMAAACAWCAAPMAACAQDNPANDAGGDAGRGNPPDIQFAPRIGEMLEAAVYAAAREAAKNPPDAKTLIPEMATMYRELAVDEVLSRSKRAKLQKTLEFHMIELGIFVMNDYATFVRKQQKLARSNKNQNRGSLGDEILNSAVAAGGQERANAQDLIDLITSTIAPDSWDINGGLGSIRYWSLTPALVVRQTGASDDLARLLRGLR